MIFLIIFKEKNSREEIHREFTMNNFFANEFNFYILKYINNENFKKNQCDNFYIRHLPLNFINFS